MEMLITFNQEQVEHPLLGGERERGEILGLHRLCPLPSLPNHQPFSLPIHSWAPNPTPSPAVS